MQKLSLLTIQRLSVFVELAILIVMVVGLALIYFSIINFQKNYPSTSIGNAALERDTAKEIAVCVVDSKFKNNSVYYHLPLIGAQLICDGPGSAGANGGINTLTKLYADGWSLAKIIDPSLDVTEGEIKRKAYPALYLERYKSKKK